MSDLERFEFAVALDDIMAAWLGDHKSLFSFMEERTYNRLPDRMAELPNEFAMRFTMRSEIIDGLTYVIGRVEVYRP